MVQRRLDELGRLVIPVDARNALGLNEKSLLNVTVEGKKIILENSSECCKLCGCAEDVNPKEQVCQSCINRIKAL